MPLNVSQGVVRSMGESDVPVGALGITKLSSKIHRLWGGILPPSVTASPLYNEWFTYFIELNHDFGIVHA